MTWQHIHLLTPVVFLPAVGALVIAMLPAQAKGLLKGMAFFWTAGVFLFSLLLWVGFDPNVAGYQFEEKALWIPSLNSYYHLGIDGISLFLVLLTTLLMPIVIAAGFSGVTDRVKEYMIHMLIIETGMLGALVAIDVFMFYIFWEVMLIPMYFLIGVWGGKRRIYATLKFVLFTMFGSLLMLVAFLYLYFKHQMIFGSYSTDLPDMLKLVPQLSLSEQLWLFGGFALAFGIKVPMWPFHTWLPDAHTEAPTGGSVILAGVMLKMGGYGFLRFAIPLFPLAMHSLSPVLATLAVIGIVYGALVCIVQPDMKRLIAYSSVSHLGFVMLGVAAMSVRSLEGSVYQMLNHGISTGALFLLVGVIYERRHTREISEYGGLAKVMPAYATLFLITALASIGLPGLNGFVGEFLILMGTFTSAALYPGWLFASIGATGVIFAAVYLLWMYQRVMFGPLKNEKNTGLKDLNPREWGYLLPLVVLMFVMGIMPNIFLTPMEPTIKQLTRNYYTAIETAGNTDSAAASGGVQLQPRQPALHTIRRHTSRMKPPRTQDSTVITVPGSGKRVPVKALRISPRGPNPNALRQQQPSPVKPRSVGTGR